ncbi:regulator of chromosome condensation (RCC1) repeat protein [Ruminiclostridium hungatei]|uniref:Regulator of chromosome condensation (RCC1) repeat protein n=1 Tax=Ruminiclostridium hungatei TaxID=48256 RepID=A0A1V4SG67_RUMHU|nr:hypothetical protein [Ruminiclostridium hungatei]OPX42475.1 regulator of chromosome condensation (RCC1) repeat protein [Ruminiclostridium hungatei]
MKKHLQKHIKRFTILASAVILILSMSGSIFAAAAKISYTSIMGGSNDIYFTASDGKVYKSQYNKTELLQIKELTNVKMASSDMYYGLWALSKSGEVNYYEQDYEIPNKYTLKKKIENLTKVGSISVGSEGIYALKTDGTVWGVGNNLKAFEVKGLKDVVSISMRDFDAIALKKDGTVWQWCDKQLIADFVDQKKPQQVQGLKNAVQVSAGADCGLALLKDNTVWQWSFNSDSAKKPVKITGFTGIKQIEAGRMTGYALDGKGDVWEWKYNSEKIKPAKVKGLSSITKIAASGKDAYDGFSTGYLGSLDKNNKLKFIYPEY